nr:TolC family protein [bacterium]
MRFFALVFLLLFSVSIFSDDTVGKEKVSLASALKRTLNYNGELIGERKSIDLAQGRIDQARAALFPKTELYIMGAPVFQHTGDALQSQSNWSKWGAFATIRGTMIQPIYTFGVVDEYKNAAKHGYDVETNKVKNKEEDLIYRTKQFYYGLQLANDMVDLVGEANSKMDGAVKKAEELLEKNKIKREDLYALKTFYSQIKIKSDEALRGKYLAEKALVWTMGLPRDTKVELDEEYLYPEDVDLSSEDKYVAMA